MKSVKLFMFKGCPHCAQALKFWNQLVEAHSEYKGVSLEIIDEKLQPELADQYDYYYVPTFFVDNQKVHEGAVSLEAVRNVLHLAVGEA